MISIIIPTFNRAHLISRAIRSVINQSYAHWELIIVDDGSTDETPEVVQEFLSDDRIKYIKKENSGATQTRNIGVDNAVFPYITFLDSDDEATPDWLLHYHNELEKGAKVICCGFAYYDHEGNYVSENLPGKLGNIYSNRIGRFSNGGVFLLSKEIFQFIGGYDKEVQSGQHSELALRLIKVLDERNIDINNINKVLIKVHIHEGDKIRSNYNAIVNGTLYTIKKHKKLFDNNPQVCSDYLSVAAVSAIKLNKIELAQKLFLQSWLKTPSRIKILLRLGISYLPFLAKKMWKP